MSKVRELLHARRREIAAQLAPLKAELKEIDTALAAIEERVVMPAGHGRRKPSISHRALEILSDTPQGLATGGVVEQMKSRFDREITNRNMSWHLSRLKTERKIIQVGELWRLPPGQNEALA